MSCAFEPCEAFDPFCVVGGDRLACALVGGCVVARFPKPVLPAEAVSDTEMARARAVAEARRRRARKGDEVWTLPTD